MENRFKMNNQTIEAKIKRSIQDYKIAEKRFEVKEMVKITVDTLNFIGQESTDVSEQIYYTQQYYTLRDREELN